MAVGNNRYRQCDVKGWKDVVSVSAGYLHTIGLKLDGTVMAMGLNKQHQCDVSSWKDIVKIAAGSSHTIGLKSDGTVVAVGVISIKISMLYIITKPWGDFFPWLHYYMDSVLDYSVYGFLRGLIGLRSVDYFFKYISL